VSVYFFGTLGTSPGTSTSAAALALYWPRPVLLIEADTSKPSSVIPGLMRGNESNERGLQQLSLRDHEKGHLTEEDLWEQVVPLKDRDTPVPERWERWLLPAFSAPGAGQGMTTFWGELARLVTAPKGGAVDVIVDAGRLQVGDPRLALADVAETSVIHVANSLPSLAAAMAQLKPLVERLESIDNPEPLKLLITETPPKGYGAKDISRSLGLPVAGVLPWDPVSAAFYSNGDQPQARFHRKPLPAAIATLGDELMKSTTSRRESLLSDMEAYA
jgi:hypothetical protein